MEATRASEPNRRLIASTALLPGFLPPDGGPYLKVRPCQGPAVNVDGWPCIQGCAARVTARRAVSVVLSVRARRAVVGWVSFVVKEFLTDVGPAGEGGGWPAIRRVRSLDKHKRRPRPRLGRRQLKRQEAGGTAARRRDGLRRCEAGQASPSNSTCRASVKDGDSTRTFVVSIFFRRRVLLS